MKWSTSAILFFINYLILSSHSQICESLIDKYDKEDDLIQSITSEFESLKTESTNCIKQLLLSGNFKALESYATLLNDNNVKFKEDLQNSINNIETQLDDIANKFRFDENDYQKVVPSLRWAQSLKNVFIQIKFSHRFDAPGCTEVENIKTTIEESQIALVGECVLSDIPIQFVLNLPLIDSIDKSQSLFVHKSSGPYFELLKREPKYWANIISEENKKNFNQITIWYEMKEKYANELKEYEEASSEEEKSYEQIEQELKEQMRQERRKKKKNNKKKSRSSKKNPKAKADL